MITSFDEQIWIIIFNSIKLWLTHISRARFTNSVRQLKPIANRCTQYNRTAFIFKKTALFPDNETT